MIVGLIGLAGAGKDTAALALTSIGYRRLAFADQLKYLAAQMGWNGVKDEKGRKLLQDLGMAARQYNPNVWIERVANHPAFTYKNPMVITDVRFANEAEWVLKNGGILIRIVRIGLECDSHISETKQAEIAVDYEVSNDGSIEELHNKILAIITHAKQ